MYMHMHIERASFGSADGLAPSFPYLLAWVGVCVRAAMERRWRWIPVEVSGGVM